MSINPTGTAALSNTGKFFMGAGAIAALGLGATSFTHNDAACIATTATLGALFIGGIITARVMDKAAELDDGDPFVGLNNDGVDKSLHLYCDDFRFYTTHNTNTLWIDNHGDKTAGDGTVGIKLEVAGPPAALPADKITLTVGASTVVIEDATVTITSANVKIDGKLEVTGGFKANAGALDNGWT